MTQSNAGNDGLPALVREWAAERQARRAARDYAAADRLRGRLSALGYNVKDTPLGPEFSRVEYPSAEAVPSDLEQAPQFDWSVNVLAGEDAGAAVRAAQSALRFGPPAGHSLEVVLVDDGTPPAAAQALTEFAAAEAAQVPAEAPLPVRVVRLAQPLGEGAGRNAGLRAARGRHVLILGTHMELVGDVFTPLTAALQDERVGAAGSNPLVTRDLFSFEPASAAGSLVEADALEFYLFAFRRDRLQAVGWLDEKFVFYRNLDLDWSLAFKDRGLRLVGVPGLPARAHEHPYQRMDPDERDRLSRKNYRRFLDKWRGKTDLLEAPEGQQGNEGNMAGDSGD